MPDVTPLDILQYVPAGVRGDNVVHQARVIDRKFQGTCICGPQKRVILVVVPAYHVRPAILLRLIESVPVDLLHETTQPAGQFTEACGVTPDVLRAFLRRTVAA